MATMTLELPETAFAAFRKSPAEFVDAMKVTALVKWHEEGRREQFPKGLRWQRN